MAIATLTYIGRILSLTPVELGSQFEDACTVPKVILEQGCAANKWKKRYIPVPIRNWWRAEHFETQELSFYTLAGYGARIEYTLRQLGHEVMVKDALPCGLPMPDFDQIAGTEFRGSQQDVLMRCITNRNGVVKCPTGFGKSFLVAKICRLYPTAKIVITVSSVAIAHDFHRDMKIWLTDLGFCGDGRHDVRRVTIAVSHSLKYCDHEWTNLVLCDECHTLAAPQFVESLAAFRRAKFIGLSASPIGRSDGTDGMIEALFGPLIADVPYSEAVASGNVVPITVLIYNNPTGPDVEHMRDTAFERTAVWSNMGRNRLIARINDYALRTYGVDNQILNMVSKTEHAFRLQQVMPTYKAVHGAVDPETILEMQKDGVLFEFQPICTKKQQAEYKTAFEKGEIRKAIATLIWSKGVNFQDLAHLVRCDAVGSVIDSTQVPGRTSRLGSEKDKGMGYLHDIYDEFSPRLKTRSQKRIAEYRKHGWTIQRVAL